MKREKNASSEPKGRCCESEKNPLTEAGNAARFLRRFRQDYFYCPELRSWFSWDAKRHRWILDKGQGVMTVMLESVRETRRELGRLEGRELQDVIRHLVRSETSRSLKGALDIAAAERHVSAERLDSDRMLLNLENGTLDLRTGKLRKAQPEDLITKLAPVKFDPDAHSPELDAFLQHLTKGDRDFLAFIGRTLGYLLTGLTDEDKCLLLHGPTRTGKSTFLLLLRAMMGDYACAIPFDALLQRESGRGGTRPELARCAGTRVVTASEVADGRAFDAATLKALTGGDPIVVHSKYQHPFEMRPTFKLVLAANAAPRLPQQDDACRERLLVLPFTQPFGETDKTVRDRLQEPGARSALLALAVRGLAEFQRHGLGSCEVVERATKAYWDGSGADTVERSLLDMFFSTCTRIDPAARTSSRELFSALARLAQETEVRCPSTQRLAVALQARGFSPHRGAKVRGWQGLRLVQAPDLASDGVTQ